MMSAELICQEARYRVLYWTRTQIVEGEISDRRLVQREAEALRARRDVRRVVILREDEQPINAGKFFLHLIIK